MEGVRVRRPVVRVDAGVRVSEGEEKEEEDRKQHAGDRRTWSAAGAR